MTVYEFLAGFADSWWGWLPLAAWIGFQAAALVGLRGIARMLCAAPIPFMAWIAGITYTAIRADSNLAGLAATMSAPIALLWVVLCLWLSPADLTLKLRVTRQAGFVTAGLVLLNLAGSLIATVDSAKARERQSREADAIIGAIGPRVLVGTVRGDEVTPALLESVGARIKAQSHVYQTCYEHGVDAERGAAGLTVVTLAIHSDGTVSSATVTRSSGASDAEGCILQALRRLRFDSRANAGETVVTVPMQFEQS